MKYRMLELGEVIEDGDEFLNGTGNWVKSTIYVGIKYQPGMTKYRRPIKDACRKKSK